MATRHPFVVLAAASCLIALASCSVTETGNPATATGTFLPQHGGALTLEAAKVEFDPGDLPGEESIEITMSRTDKSAPNGYQVFSALYEFQPSMVFERPVRVCLPATDAPGSATIHWSRQSSEGGDSGFDPVATTIANGVACGEVAHFSRGFVGVSDALPQWTGRKVDLLFVVDDSESMIGEQENLQRNFARLIEALRNHALGPDGSGRPCTSTDTSGCRIPDVHVGVISPDLGAGAYSELFVGSHCGDEGGRGGRLQNIASETGCPQPSDPWISYTFDEKADQGQTNVATGSSDPIERVKESFSCIAKLGNKGCGFEQPLEAARLALDPLKDTNPGFVRDDALLAVVFITDEDDCSAANEDLFDPRNKDLGALNFRCFEYGIQCDGIVPGQNAREEGPRTGCKPGFEWLEPVTGPSHSYEAFYRGLKAAGGVILAALAGPSSPVGVKLFKNAGTGLMESFAAPSCTRSEGESLEEAAPAIRIKTLVDSLGSSGQFASICTDDFGPALKTLGDKIASTLEAL